jgi:hypothetical protein
MEKIISAVVTCMLLTHFNTANGALPYPLSAVIPSEYGSGLNDTHLAMLSATATMLSEQNPQAPSQYIICTEIRDDLPAPARKQLLQETLLTNVQTIVVDKGKSRACFVGAISLAEITAKDIISKGFTWQAYSPLLKINKKLAKVVESRLDSVDTNGRALTIQYLNTSRIGTDTHIEDMQRNLNALKNIFSQPLTTRPAFYVYGDWGAVQRYFSNPPCTALPTIQENDIRAFSVWIHISFEIFKPPLPADCFIIIVDRLSVLAEVGKLGVGIRHK